MADKQISDLSDVGATLNVDDVIALDSTRTGGAPISHKANLSQMIDNWMSSKNLNFLNDVNAQNPAENDVLIFTQGLWTNLPQGTTYCKPANNLSEIVTNGSVENTRTNLDVYSKGEVDTNLNDHAILINNPHSVTKSQVGLSDVQNYGITDLYTGTSTLSYVSQKAVNDAWVNAKEYADGIVATHDALSDNPHAVTKSQVGLGSVLNYGINHTHTSSSTTLYASAHAVNDAYNSAVSASGKKATNGSNSNGWWHKCADTDMITQWEVKTSAVASGTRIYLPIAYANTNYSVTITCDDNSNLAFGTVYSKTSNSFRVYFGNGNSSEKFQFTAVGY